MFYCDPCALPRKWPTDTFVRSHGPCEICGNVSNCNDVPSKYLPIPPRQPAVPEEK